MSIIEIQRVLAIGLLELIIREDSDIPLEEIQKRIIMCVHKWNEDNYIAPYVDEPMADMLDACNVFMESFIALDTANDLLNNSDSDSNNNSSL